MDSEYRDEFINSVVRFFDQVSADSNGKTFAGIDIDWEPNENHWSFVEKSEGAAKLNDYLELVQGLTFA